MNKREPLLSDEQARNILKNCAYNPGTMNPVAETAAYYESLIDSGKLRVVEEVGLVPGWDGALSCPCGEPHFEGVNENYCPACGNKIKR